MEWNIILFITHAIAGQQLKQYSGSLLELIENYLQIQYECRWEGGYYCLVYNLQTSKKLTTAATRQTNLCRGYKRHAEFQVSTRFLFHSNDNLPYYSWGTLWRICLHQVSWYLHSGSVSWLIIRSVDGNGFYLTVCAQPRSCIISCRNVLYQEGVCTMQMIR